MNSTGEVVYRLLGADEAPELLKKVKLGVESGGLSGLRKRYQSGERDLDFVGGYINVLAAANCEKEAGKVATDFLQGKEQKYWKMSLTFGSSIIMCMILILLHFCMS